MDSRFSIPSVVKFQFKDRVFEANTKILQRAPPSTYRTWMNERDGNNVDCGHEEGGDFFNYYCYLENERCLSSLDQDSINRLDGFSRLSNKYNDTGLASTVNEALRSMFVSKGLDSALDAYKESVRHKYHFVRCHSVKFLSEQLEQLLESSVLENIEDAVAGKLLKDIAELRRANQTH